MHHARKRAVPRVNYVLEQPGCLLTSDHPPGAAQLDGWARLKKNSSQDLSVDREGNLRRKNQRLVSERT